MKEITDFNFAADDFTAADLAKFDLIKSEKEEDLNNLAELLNKIIDAKVAKISKEKDEFFSKQLASKELELDIFYNQSPCGYFSTDGKGIINQINDTLLVWLGYAKEDIIGKVTWQSLLSVGGKMYFETHYSPLLQMQGFVKEISFEMVKKDKTRLPILINTKQIRDENGKVQINYSTVFDISQRKSYEKELLKAKKTVEQQNELIQETNEKFQASEEELKSTIEEIERLNENLNKQKIALTSSNKELEQFAYVASHDLQEPLRMVTSFLTQLENKYAAVIDDKGKQYIGFAVDGAKRMRQIILDLLEYSKIGRTEEVKDYLDLNTLIDGIKILLRETIEENKAVLIIDHLPKIYSYWSPMRQVFQNLITNALKYSKKEIPTEIHITVKDLKDYWQFSVTDNGIGIEKEYHEKIFIIFQRLHTKEEYSGTGIGLAIVKKIIEIQDGKIWVESEKGKGSTFYFTIKK